MRLFVWLAEDPSGVIYKMFGRTVNKYAAMSYRNTINKKIRMATIYELMYKAVEDAALYINAVFCYSLDLINEDELSMIIGNKSYSTGEIIC